MQATTRNRPTAPRGARRPRALVALGLLVLSACGATRGPAVASYPELRPARLGSMRNVRVCAETTWFGSVPSTDDLDLAARRGVRRVVDLRAPSERAADPGVRGDARALGLEYVAPELPEDAVDTTEAQLEVVLGHFADVVGHSGHDHTHERVLLFCEDGSRCALFFAVHRAAHDGVPLDEALLEARRNGVKGADRERFVRKHAAARS